MTGKALLEHLGSQELDFEIVLSTGQKFSTVKVDTLAKTICFVADEGSPISHVDSLLDGLNDK